jgi:hypothetical protein
MTTFVCPDAFIARSRECPGATTRQGGISVVVKLKFLDARLLPRALMISRIICVNHHGEFHAGNSFSNRVRMAHDVQPKRQLEAPCFGAGGGALIGNQLQGHEEVQQQQQEEINRQSSELRRQREELQKIKKQGEY